MSRDPGRDTCSTAEKLQGGFDFGSLDQRNPRGFPSSFSQGLGAASPSGACLVSVCAYGVGLEGRSGVILHKSV